MTTSSLPVTSIRRAVIRDVPAILELMAPYIQEGVLLPVTIYRLFERIRDFVVAEDGESLVGCGSLLITWHDLAEVRSLTVRKGFQGGGVGRRIVEALVQDAEELGVNRVFALTRQPGFFSRLDFEEVAKETLPHKVWKDCQHCPRFTHCDEIAVARTLAPPMDASPVTPFPASPVDPDLILPSPIG